MGNTPSVAEEIDVQGLNNPNAMEIPLNHMGTMVPLTRGVKMPMNALSAMYINGDLLGIPCSTIPAKSAYLTQPDLVPPELHPTPLQLTRFHPTWIDRFPCSGMRDRLITFMELFDEEDFIRDLFCMESFRIEPGGDAWNPNSWTVCEPFATKWGFLLDSTRHT